MKAEQCFILQSAISQQIKAIENDLGIYLQTLRLLLVSISFTNGLSLKIELIERIVLLCCKKGGHSMKKMLIVYYSWSNGNIKRISEMLQEKTDAGIVRIDTVEPCKGSCNDEIAKMFGAG